MCIIMFTLQTCVCIVFSVINDYPCLGPVAVVLAGYISDAPKSGGGASGGGASGSTGRGDECYYK